MSTALTSNQKQALAQLVMHRYCAKKLVQTKKIRQSNIAHLTEIIDAATNLEQVHSQALDYLKHTIIIGLCVLAILGDAYQFPLTVTSVAARAASVSEMVTAAEGRAPWGMPLAKS